MIQSPPKKSSIGITSLVIVDSFDEEWKAKITSLVIVDSYGATVRSERQRSLPNSPRPMNYNPQDFSTSAPDKPSCREKPSELVIGWTLALKGK